MENVWKQSELLATMPTRVGLLRDICRALSDKRVDIRSIEAYDNDANGEFYLITSDDWAAESVLREWGPTSRSQTSSAPSLRTAPVRCWI